MAKQKYAIRQIPALGIISALRRENGDRRFFFDAAGSSKEYTVERTKRDDCEYAVFPAANFNACRGSTAFSKKKLPQLPRSVFDREERHGFCGSEVIL